MDDSFEVMYQRLWKTESYDCWTVIVLYLYIYIYISVILDNMSEIVGFVALSDNEDDNKENRRQTPEHVETANLCTHNVLSTHKPTNFV